MNGPLLKTPAVQPGAATMLAGHPRAAAPPPAASVRDASTASTTAATDQARLAQQQARLAQQRTDEELDALRRAAHDEGLRQGRLEAQRLGEQTMARQDAALQAMVSAVEAAVRERLDSLEEFALAIAYQACGTVLSQAALDGSAVADIVRRLLQPLRQAGGVRVQLHPDDLARVTHALRDDPRIQGQTLRIEADSTLSRGDCRVVTSHGQLETGLDVQLSAIRESLLATRASIGLCGDTTP